MAFSVDHKEALSGGGVVPPGEYEVVVKTAFQDITKKSNAVFINIPLIIRNDIQQGYQNVYLWHKLWKRKEPTDQDLQCEGYSFKQIQSICKAAGIPDGQSFETLEAWCDELAGKCMRVTVKNEEYNGNTQAKVAYANPSKTPDCNHVFKSTDGAAADVGFAEMDNDGDLPF